MNKKKAILSIVCNALIVAFTFLAILNYFVTIWQENLQGAKCFRYFTIDSNILCAITSIFMIVGAIKYLNGKKVPYYFTILKFVGTSAVMLTFLTVCFFLYPFNASLGLYFFFGGSGFFLHFFCPVLALVSLVFFEKYENVSKKSTIFAMLPILVYGTVYVICVWFTKVWPDIYGFTFGYKVIITPVIVMLLFQYGIIWGVYGLTQIKSKRQ